MDLKQVCFIILAVEETEQESVRLELGEARISTEKELPEYFITDQPKSPTIVQGEEGEVLMKIIFKRRLSNEVAWFHIYVLLMEINPRP